MKKLVLRFIILVYHANITCYVCVSSMNVYSYHHVYFHFIRFEVMLWHISFLASIINSRSENRFTFFSWRAKGLYRRKIFLNITAICEPII
jgi:hypothetical protein